MAFDLRTHHLDGKGKLTRETPYRLVVDNGIQRFERPPGSGFWYDGAGGLIQQPEVKAAAPAAPEKPVQVEQALDQLDRPKRR